MNQELLLKRDMEYIKKKLDVANSSWMSSERVCKKLRKKMASYSNQYKVIVSELNIKYQQLSKDKMLAEGVKDIIRKEKIIAQMETVDQVRSMILQKIALCQ